MYEDVQSVPGYVRLVRTRAPDPPILACIADARLQAALHPRMQHPGGGNRGAVYVLFLKSDGKVKTEQKISSTQGNLATQWLQMKPWKA